MKKYCSLFIIILATLAILVSGCGEDKTSSSNTVVSDSDSPQYENWLKADAQEGFSKAIERDYRRLTVISGSLNRLNSSDHPEIELGKALGAIEASTFIEESEYTRLDNNINITPEIKKELVAPGLLNVLYKNHKLMDHIYHDILKPYEELVSSKKTQTVEQEKIVTQTKSGLMQITEIFSKLAGDKKSFSGSDVEGLVTQLDKVQTELMSVYYPLQKQVDVKKSAPLPVSKP